MSCQTSNMWVVHRTPYETKLWHCSDQTSKFSGILFSAFTVLIGFWFRYRCFIPGKLYKNDTVRISLWGCSVAGSNKLLPVANRVCHFWLWDYWGFICAVVALLRIPRLSYVKMRDCGEKQQRCGSNLSISPFSLPLPSAFQCSHSVSFSSSLTCLHVSLSAAPASFISGCLFPFATTLFLSFHSSPLPLSYIFFPFFPSLAHNLRFNADFLSLWPYDECRLCWSVSEIQILGLWQMGLWNMK